MSPRNRALHAAASKVTSVPKCAACQFGKQGRRPLPGKVTAKIADKEGALKKEDLLPGQRVSVDHFVCSTKGRLLSGFGKASEDNMHCGSCLFADHVSKCIHVVLQLHPNSHKMLKAKETCELLMRDFRVVVQEFLGLEHFVRV